MKTYGMYINGQYVHSGETIECYDPASLDGLTAFAKVAYLTSKNVGSGKDSEQQLILDACIEGAHQTFLQIQRGFFPLSERLSFLTRLQKKLDEHTEIIAQTLSLEVAKPITLARLELARAKAVLDWTLQQTPELLTQQHLITETQSATQNLRAWTRREPRGPLLAITPFNFPINLVIHKIIPALISGCPVILKPSPKALSTALALIDLIHSCELPAGMLSLINCDNTVCESIAMDQRIPQISFTGSASVGWMLKKKASSKHVFLELGGNAPAYVDSSADLKAAAKKICNGAFSYSGQVCISTQNLSIHQSVYKEFTEELKNALSQFQWGHPSHEQVISSCVIDKNAYIRIRGLMKDVINNGAAILAQGSHPLGLTMADLERLPQFIPPTIYENVPKQHIAWTEETFAPLLNVEPIASFEDWVTQSSQQSYRLQAAIFTTNSQQIQQGTQQLPFGGVIINESTALRLDHMPYGGRGLSGTGREGPRYAIEDFTEWKTVVARL